MIRTLELFTHSDGDAIGQVSIDGNELNVDPLIVDVVHGQRRRLAEFFRRSPTNQELLENPMSTARSRRRSRSYRGRDV
jgi:hypothetical protein